MRRTGDYFSFFFVASFYLEAGVWAHRRTQASAFFHPVLTTIAFLTLTRVLIRFKICFFSVDIDPLTVILRMFFEDYCKIFRKESLLTSLLFDDDFIYKQVAAIAGAFMPHW